jgi:hypothetical protein
MQSPKWFDNQGRSRRTPLDMRSMTKRVLAWRGFPFLAVLLLLSPAIFFIACDDTGPSPIGEHEPDPTASDSGNEAAAADAEPEAGDDAGDEAGEDAGEEAGEDAGDAGDAGDADADAKNP